MVEKWTGIPYPVAEPPENLNLGVPDPPYYSPTLPYPPYPTTTETSSHSPHSPVSPQSRDKPDFSEYKI